MGCTATVGVLSCPDLSEDPPNIQVSEIDRELPVPFSIYESDSRLESEDKEVPGRYLKNSTSSEKGRSETDAI